MEILRENWEMRYDPDVVAALLSAGADPAVVDAWHWSPLFWAAKKGHADVVRVLLRAPCRAGFPAEEEHHAGGVLGGLEAAAPAAEGGGKILLCCCPSRHR